MLFGGLSSEASANLLVNGSFETGVAEDLGNFTSINLGSTAIDGWTVVSAQIDYIQNLWPASDGLRSLDLHGTPGVGGVAQTVLTSPGQSYRVTFDLAGNPEIGGVKRLTVSAAGQEQTFDFDTTGRSFADLGWVERTFDFVADASSTTLTFQSQNLSFGSFQGPTIDNVQLVASGANLLTGDYNGDGFVSQGDLDLVLLNWGDGVLPGGFDPAAIPGGGPFDGLVSQNELDGVLLNWGDGTPPTPGSVNAIPEPASAVLLAGLWGLAGRSRRRG